MVQPAEEIIFNSNSTERYKNIFRHETGLKWIKALRTPFPSGFNDNINHEGNTSKMPDFVVFSLLDVRKCNGRSRGKCKNGHLKRKCLDICRFMQDPKIQTSSNAFETFFD